MIYVTDESLSQEPKGTLPLQANCRVSEIRSDLSKKRKQFVFKITWPSGDVEEENAASISPAAAADSESKTSRASSSSSLSTSRKKGAAPSAAVTAPGSKKKESTLSASKVAALAVGGVIVGSLTAGLGLLAGMVVVGVGAAAGGGAAALQQTPEKEYTLVVACETYQDAELWVLAIETQLRELGAASSSSGLSFLPYIGFGASSAGGYRMLTAKQKAPPSHVKLEEVEEWVKADKWRTTEVWQGVRLLEQMEDSDDNGGGISSSVNSAAAPCYRVNMALNGTASDAYVTIMNMPPLSRSGIIRTMRIVEAVDNNTDVIYLQLQPTYIYPTWTCKSRHTSIIAITIASFSCGLCCLCLSW